jgi:uncharacterized protein (DUF2249 family)/hemerythrin superfamily protein
MSRRTVDLDLRGMKESDREEELFRSFRGLLPGDTIHVVLDGDARALLEALERERRGEFEWSPVEEGPRVVRVRIDRRAPAGKRKGVMDYLAWDHDRLDATVSQARLCIERREWAAGLSAFAEFRAGLVRHIRMEEEVLFPTFEERTGIPAGGPTAVMREEHRQIEDILGDLAKLADRAATALAQGMEGPPAVQFERKFKELLNLLADHNTKEEEVLYPMTDHHLDEDERDAIVRRMQRVVS